MDLGGFEPTIPTSERPQTRALDRAVTGPGGPRPPHSRVSQLHLDTPYLVGLLWTSDQPIAETSS